MGMWAADNMAVRVGVANFLAVCALRTPIPSIAAFKDSDIIAFIRTDGQTDMA